MRSIRRRIRAIPSVACGLTSDGSYFHHDPQNCGTSGPRRHDAGAVDARRLCAALARRRDIGSIPGVLLGSHYSIRVPERALRMSFAIVLVLSGIKLLEVPFATLIIVASVALGAVALLAWLALHLRGRRLQPVAD